MNSLSLQSGDGGMCSSWSLASTGSSIALNRSADVKVASGIVTGNGERTRASATPVRNETAMAVSPGPFTVTRPSSSTCATVSSAVPYFAQCVTSAVVPSVKEAVTDSGTVAPAASVSLPGVTSIRDSLASLSRGAGMPDAIHVESTRYSGESTVNRRPPTCGTVSVGLSRMRLLAGSILLTRRPPACRVIVS